MLCAVFNPQADLYEDSLIDIFDAIVIDVNFGKASPVTNTNSLSHFSSIHNTLTLFMIKKEVFE